jgi:16S rRNA C967 or C1407 C5-methylase (RsmB/RsmF family)/NOL1/NOP2/fmu family ribosome biogenesis protein
MDQSRLPTAFINRMQTLLCEEWGAFEQSLKEESPVSIRINRFKNYSLPNDWIEKVPWASDAYYVPFRPSFTLDPLFHAGCYYVQEASSMFLEQVTINHVSHPVKVLDLCAAPGGKSTQLISVLPEGSLLVANEVIRSRAYVLFENLTKWGNPHTIVTQSDPLGIGKLTHFFDVIVADVPCSGEGMFRKDPVAVREWSVENIHLCAKRQKRIIADSWNALRPGGLLIYSTCTYNREENEENIEWICQNLGADPVEIYHRFMPHRVKGEGFFITAVKKKEGIIKKKEKKNRCSSFIPSEVKKWLVASAGFSFFSENNNYIALPSMHADSYEFLKERLKIISAGTFLGEKKGKDLIPTHNLALSHLINTTAFPSWDLDTENALKYLRKETLPETPSDLPQGYILVTYRLHPLGFIKNIGIRTNNLYPQEWRIRIRVK